MKQTKIRDKNYNCSNAIYYHIQGLESENRLFNMEIKAHEQSEIELSKRINKAIEYINKLPVSININNQTLVAIATIEKILKGEEKNEKEK